MDASRVKGSTQANATAAVSATRLEPFEALVAIRDAAADALKLGDSIRRVEALQARNVVKTE